MAGLVTAVGFAGAAMAVDVNDTCDVGGGANDIDTLTASYDVGMDEITVDMLLCADPSQPSNKTKYRVHIDHTAPFLNEADRNGDGIVDANDFCFTTSDDTMMRRRHRGTDKDTGPGIIEVDGNTLTFTVGVDDLNPGLLLGDTVFIWADTQFRGINDRAPNTESGDSCSKPEVATEVLALTLEPPENIVFVSSSTHTGNLGGLAGADAQCQARADAAGLGGNYKAWLADNTGSPATRFVQATVPYVRTDSVRVADDYNDLINCGNPTCLQAPINKDESGGLVPLEFVWTNVSISGAAVGGTNCNTCSSWSTASAGCFTSLSGRTDKTDPFWTILNRVSCNVSLRLYCFEQ